MGGFDQAETNSHPVTDAHSFAFSQPGIVPIPVTWLFHDAISVNHPNSHGVSKSVRFSGRRPCSFSIA